LDDEPVLMMSGPGLGVSNFSSRPEDLEEPSFVSPKTLVLANSAIEEARVALEEARMALEEQRAVQIGALGPETIEESEFVSPETTEQVNHFMLAMRHFLIAQLCFVLLVSTCARFKRQSSKLEP
jgi:hypothetical protein